jgi:hypothetical protein
MGKARRKEKRKGYIYIITNCDLCSIKNLINALHSLSTMFNNSKGGCRVVRQVNIVDGQSLMT